MTDESIDVESRLGLQLPSRIDRLYLPGITQQVYIKRDDLIHPEISGNKWRKLQGNVAAFCLGDYRGILSYGGAFSNHLHAAAKVAQILEIPFTAIIRGDGFDPDNPSLAFLQKCGAELIFVNRSSYRQKEASPEIRQIIRDRRDYLIIPEGGSNENAFIGVATLMAEVDDHFDYIILPVGTAATLAGIVRHAPSDTKVLGIAALKDMSLGDKWKGIFSESSSEYQINYDYTFGGYARYTEQLIQFVQDFQTWTGILLDPIYTAKMAYGAYDLMKRGIIPSDARVLLLHTGGLQGREGFVYLNPDVKI